MKQAINYALYPIIFVLIVVSVYLGLFSNDAAVNYALIISAFGKSAVILLNILLVAVVVPMSLKLMDITTGKFGLERFKGIFAISIGMTTLGFSALQFINAIATSSAEGATVVVEVVQQIAHLSTTGELEEYGLIGMLTSDASGPWNSSIFPLIIFVVWLIRGKKVRVELKQLNVPMFIQFVLYAQQFLFALDLKYTFFEIILMGITGTLFVVGMISFMVSMFKKSEEQEEEALKEAEKYAKPTQEKTSNLYSRTIRHLAQLTFNLITLNPGNIKAQQKFVSVQEKKGGYGQISRFYVIMNALQLTLSMTVAMFMLVLSMQFFAVQLKMSDAEAALFGTAGITSAPEALLALTAGPYINALLLVGSNIIDGWMSSIGQTILLGYAEIVSNGHINFIPLHPAIKYLTFLSWTQGILVWGALVLYAKNSKKAKALWVQITVSIVLAISIIYYFGGAWFSAQALGYGADYALQSLPFKTLTSVINTLEAARLQQVGLILNIAGFIALVLWWSGIVNKIKDYTKPDEFEKNYESKLNSLVSEFNIVKDQQVVVLLDRSASMSDTRLFEDEWIDIVFGNISDLALILDDDAHVHIYTTYANIVEDIPTLLNPRNKGTFIEKHVGRETYDEIYYAPAINRIYEEYKNKLTNKHNPVMVICLTDGFGKDYDELIKALNSISSLPIYVHFLLLYGSDKPTSVKDMQRVCSNLKSGHNFGYSLLPTYKLSDRDYVKDIILEKYAEFIKYALDTGLLYKR